MGMILPSLPEKPCDLCDKASLLLGYSPFESWFNDSENKPYIQRTVVGILHGFYPNSKILELGKDQFELTFLAEEAKPLFLSAYKACLARQKEFRDVSLIGEINRLSLFKQVAIWVCNLTKGSFVCVVDANPGSPVNASGGFPQNHSFARLPTIITVLIYYLLGPFWQGSKIYWESGQAKTIEDGIVMSSHTLSELVWAIYRCKDDLEKAVPFVALLIESLIYQTNPFLRYEN